MAKLKIKGENIYILSLDGLDLIEKTEWKEGKPLKTYEKEVYEFNTTKQKRQNIASLPYSLDLIKLLALDNEAICKNNNKLFTKAIINVTFKASLKEYKYHPKAKKEENKIKRDGKLILSKEKIRENLYQRGFIVDGIQYVEYKRSGSKARNGSTLFIREDLYEDMIKWSRIGLEFAPNEKVDIASLRAYESLSLSGLEDTLTIEKENILLVDDIERSFKTKAITVKQGNHGELVTETEDIERSNVLWDGQCLANKSLFKGNYKDQGMMLLRNRMFKACAFNTNITEFFNNNKIKVVTDMFGIEHETSNIKLIITPSCLKFFKFADKFEGETKFDKWKECYEYWIENLEETFGICKTEHPSKLGNKNRLSYQMINSLPLNNEQVKELSVYEIEYITKLRDDHDTFIDHISLYDKSPVREAIYKLIQQNRDIRYTTLFKNFKSTTLSSYKNSVRSGKVKVDNTDYMTIVSMPYEMLLATLTGAKKKDGSIIEVGYKNGDELLTEKQVYCKRFADGEKLAGFRNPNVCTGNVLYAENKKNDKFDTYFNFTNNIVIISNWDNDINDRLSGSDQDSDTVLLSNDPILVSAAEQSSKLLTPISLVKAETKKRPYNKQSMSDVDVIISKNYIGNIVNLSQILNSIYWNTRFKAENEEEIYKDIATLSVLSGIEIDKAKKLVKIDSSAEIEKIKSRYDSLTRPKFFKYTQKRVRNYENYECPMNYLVDAVDDVKRDTNDIKDKVDILTLLDRTDTNTTVNKKQITELKRIAKQLDRKKSSIYCKYFVDDEEQKFELQQVEKDAQREVRAFRVSKATMINILDRLYNDRSKDKDISSCESAIISLLIKENEKVFLSCFKSS